MERKNVLNNAILTITDSHCEEYWNIFQTLHFDKDKDNILHSLNNDTLSNIRKQLYYTLIIIHSKENFEKSELFTCKYAVKADECIDKLATLLFSDVEINVREIWTNLRPNLIPSKLSIEEPPKSIKSLEIRRKEEKKK